MSLCAVHLVAVCMTVLLIGSLVYLNMEQIREYDYLREELDFKLADLTCKRKRIEVPNPDPDPDPDPDPAPQPSRASFTSIVKEVVGECVLELLKEVNEYFLSERFLQLGADNCIPDCNCETVCKTDKSESNGDKQTQNMKVKKKKLTFAGLSPDSSEFQCQKCRLDCSKKFQSLQSSVGAPQCLYSYTHINYADSQLGARIISVQGTPFDCGNIVSCVLGSNFGKNPPENMLNSNLEPGCCFAFKGVSYVTILLSKPVYIEIIEIAHIDTCRSPTRDTSSAPKDFRVYGIENESGKQFLLGDFIYENSIPSELFSNPGEHRKFQLIGIEFQTNHGHPDYTCVYKVGVYGREN